MILKILSGILIGVTIPHSAIAVQCISLFQSEINDSQLQELSARRTQTQSTPKAQVDFSELKVANEQKLWRKVVRDGGGGELDYFLRQQFIRKFKSKPEFAEDVIDALTNQSKRFEFLFFLKSKVIQRLAREGSLQEIVDYSRTQTIPERLLRLELIEMAKNFGFDVVEVHRRLNSGDFIAMMHKRHLPIDFAFIDEAHGHLIHIFQLLQIAFHVDKKYQSQGLTAQFYQQLSGIIYHSLWDLFFDDQTDSASAPEVWNPIYQNYLKWDF